MVDSIFITKDVVYGDGDATVFEAVKIMKEKKVSSLIVKRRNEDDAFGIVTRKDIVGKVIGTGKDPKAVKVHEIMSKPLITVSPGLAIEYCARLFTATGIRRAPVFDGKKIVGILSNSDILNTIKE